VLASKQIVLEGSRALVEIFAIQRFMTAVDSWLERGCLLLLSVVFFLLASRDLGHEAFAALAFGPSGINILVAVYRQLNIIVRFSYPASRHQPVMVGISARSCLVSLTTLCVLLLRTLDLSFVLGIMLDN